MSDYISRDEIFSVWRSMPKPASISSLTDAINRTPAADVEPVRHGRWEMVYPDGTFCKGEALRTMYALLVCSECGKTFELMRMGKPRYCTCGAKMDLEDENNER